MGAAASRLLRDGSGRGVGMEQAERIIKAAQAAPAIRTRSIGVGRITAFELRE